MRDPKQPRQPNSEWSMLDLVSEAFRKLTDTLPNMITELKRESDLEEKREVYYSISQFINKRFDASLPICLGATYLICNESDPSLLKEAVLNEDAQRLAQILRDTLLEIKVHYKQLNRFQSYVRKIEIYFMKDGKPVLAKAEDEISWDSLPPDVREGRLRHGVDRMTFKLYPQEV